MVKRDEHDRSRAFCEQCDKETDHIEMCEHCEDENMDMFSKAYKKNIAYEKEIQAKDREIERLNQIISMKDNLIDTSQRQAEDLSQLLDKLTKLKTK